MKKIFFTLVVLFTTVFAYAQLNTTPSEAVKAQVEILKKADLNLTEIQIGRITTVLIGEESNETRIRKALEGNKSLLETRLAELKEHKIQNIKGAITPAQAEKFDALKLADKF